MLEHIGNIVLPIVFGVFAAISTISYTYGRVETDIVYIKKDLSEIKEILKEKDK